MSLYQFIRDPIERLFRDAEILSLVQSFNWVLLARPWQGS